MTTPTASTDTTTTNAGQAFKIGVTPSGTANINSAYGSLGSFPYLNSDNQPSKDLTGLYMKVWQDSSMYTAIKNGWSVVTGDSKTTIQAFSTAMSSATDPWSDYRFAILNKIDLSAHATQHKDNFIARAALTTGQAALYPDHFVGYCVYQNTFGGVCAEAVVTSEWDHYLDFTAPTAAPKFEFAAARFLKGSAILKIDTATDTAHTPVAIINAEAASTATKGTGALKTDNTTEILTTDSFVGSDELFWKSRYATQGDAQIGTSAAFACAAATVPSTAASCGDATASKTYAALLAETNLDYAAVGQSGFKMIGAGASYKAGAMWTYLWGWVPTITAANQTNSADLTFESNVKYIDWAVTRDISIADGTAQPATPGNCAATGCTAASASSGTCDRDCKPLVAEAIPVRTAKDLTVTRVSSGSSLVASAAAAIVAASLAF